MSGSRTDDGAIERAILSDNVLVIEASTRVGSLAVVRAGVVVGTRTVAMGFSGDDGLFPAMQEVLVECGLAPSQLTRVICGAGPGSFTSLRIAASLAKGLVHGTGATLAAVSSLVLSAAVAAEQLPDDTLDIVIHADALRGERYTQRMRVERVRVDGERMVRPDGAVERVAFDDLATYCAGTVPGALRVAVGSSPEPELEASVVLPSAAAIVRSSGWNELAAVSLDAWEPAYGRLAEAQVVWERTHGYALPAG